MAAWTIRFLALALVAPLVGKLVDHHGVRKIMPIGATIAGLGFVLLSQINNLWHFYLGWAAVGIGMASLGLIPASAVVSSWFEKRRGTALGIMGIGFGAGGVLSPLIGGYLIPNFGWRVAYFALALFMWILVPLVLLVIRTKPADMGLYPDGVEDPEAVAKSKSEKSPSPYKGITLKKALATSSFWLIGVSFLVANISEAGISQSQVPFFEDIGFSAAMAATTLAVAGICSATGKFFFGWLCDHIKVTYARSIGIGFLIAGTIILTILQPGSPVVLIWLYAILKGIGTGSWMSTMSMLTSTSFGLASYGAIFGMMSLLMSIGVGVGPLFAGYVHDITGNYLVAFIVFIILLAVAIPTILVVRRPKSL